MENGLTMFIYCELEASLGYPAMAPLPRILRAGTLEPVPRPLHSLGRENPKGAFCFKVRIAVSNVYF